MTLSETTSSSSSKAERLPFLSLCLLRDQTADPCLLASLTVGTAAAAATATVSQSALDDVTTGGAVARNIKKLKLFVINWETVNVSNCENCQDKRCKKVRRLLPLLLVI